MWHTGENLVPLITALWKHLYSCVGFVNRKKWNLSNEICFRLLVTLPNSAIKGVDGENYLQTRCMFLLRVEHERACLTVEAGGLCLGTQFCLSAPERCVYRRAWWQRTCWRRRASRFEVASQTSASLGFPVGKLHQLGATCRPETT